MDRHPRPARWSGPKISGNPVKRIFAIANAVVAGSAGVIVLLGYFLDIPLLTSFRLILLQWAVILAGWAVLVGIGNLFAVHFQKMRLRKPGAIYSMVLLFFLLVSLTVNITDPLKSWGNVLMDGIVIPVEISLMAVLAVTLIYASVRLLRARANLMSIIFIGVALIVLLGQLPFVSDLIRPFSNVLVTGGARGILIGVALGTLTTGVRILLGTDRPYGGK